MIKAAITPGTQPASVSRKTSKNDPQPLSAIAKGGKIMHNTTLQNDIVLNFLKVYKYTSSSVADCSGTKPTSSIAAGISTVSPLFTTTLPPSDSISKLPSRHI